MTIDDEAMTSAASESMYVFEGTDYSEQRRRRRRSDAVPTDADIEAFDKILSGAYYVLRCHGIASVSRCHDTVT